MTLYVELSHAVVSGEAGYPALPAPRIEPHVSHAASRSAYGADVTFEISRIWMTGNSGTYLDSPAHRFPEAVDVASIPLERLAGVPVAIFDARFGPDGRSVMLDLPPTARWHRVSGAAVLIRTGWDARRGTAAYWEPCPFVPSDLAAGLVSAGVAIVGVDFWNIDDPDDRLRPAHTTLLRAGIPIVEHLRGLHRVPSDGARFFAVPAPVAGATSFPVRAFVEVPDVDAMRRAPCRDAVSDPHR